MACPDNCQCNRDQMECYIMSYLDEIDLSSQVIMIDGVLCEKQWNLLQKLSGDVVIILKNDICYGIALCESEVRQVNCLENCKCNPYLNECFINSCDDDLELNIKRIVMHGKLCDSHRDLLEDQEGVKIFLMDDVCQDIVLCISELPISTQMSTIYTTITTCETSQCYDRTTSSAMGKTDHHHDRTSPTSQKHQNVATISTYSPGHSTRDSTSTDSTSDSSSDKELAAKYK